MSCKLLDSLIDFTLFISAKYTSSQSSIPPHYSGFAYICIFTCLCVPIPVYAIEPTPRGSQDPKNSHSLTFKTTNKILKKGGKGLFLDSSCTHNHITVYNRGRGTRWFLDILNIYSYMPTRDVNDIAALLTFWPFLMISKQTFWRCQYSQIDIIFVHFFCLNINTKSDQKKCL